MCKLKKTRKAQNILCPVFPKINKIPRRSGVLEPLAEDFIDYSITLSKYMSSPDKNYKIKNC